MGLSTDFQNRFPSNRLKQLTNPGNQAGSSVNTTLIDYAATDVEADFETYAGVEYDSADSRHVSVAVDGVLAKLYQRAETPGSKADGLHDAYIQRLRDLAKVTGRDRVVPKTTSVLTPTPERDGTETVRPDADRDDFGDLVPNAP